MFVSFDLNFKWIFSSLCLYSKWYSFCSTVLENCPSTSCFSFQTTFPQARNLISYSLPLSFQTTFSLSQKSHFVLSPYQHCVPKWKQKITPQRQAKQLYVTLIQQSFSEALSVFLYVPFVDTKTYVYFHFLSMPTMGKFPSKISFKRCQNPKINQSFWTFQTGNPSPFGSWNFLNPLRDFVIFTWKWL